MSMVAVVVNRLLYFFDFSVGLIVISQGLEGHNFGDNFGSFPLYNLSL